MLICCAQATADYYCKIYYKVFTCAQVSFSFDEKNNNQLYEISIHSSTSSNSLNQTNTSYYATGLTPGLHYNISITAIETGRRSSPTIKRFTTGATTIL